MTTSLGIGSKKVMQNQKMIYSEDVKNLLLAQGSFYHVSFKDNGYLDSIRRDGLCPKKAAQMRLKNRGREFYNKCHFGDHDVICYCTEGELPRIKGMFGGRNIITFKVNAQSIVTRAFDIDRSYSHCKISSGDPEIDSLIPESITYPDHPILVQLDDFSRGLALYGSIACFDAIPYSELTEMP